MFYHSNHHFFGCKKHNSTLLHHHHHHFSLHHHYLVLGLFLLLITTVDAAKTNNAYPLSSLHNIIQEGSGGPTGTKTRTTRTRTARTKTTTTKFIIKDFFQKKNNNIHQNKMTLMNKICGSSAAQRLHNNCASKGRLKCNNRYCGTNSVVGMPAFLVLEPSSSSSSSLSRRRRRQQSLIRQQQQQQYDLNHYYYRHQFHGNIMNSCRTSSRLFSVTSDIQTTSSTRGGEEGDTPNHDKIFLQKQPKSDLYFVQENNNINMPQNNNKRFFASTPLSEHDEEGNNGYHHDNGKEKEETAQGSVATTTTTVSKEEEQEGSGSSNDNDKDDEFVPLTDEDLSVLEGITSRPVKGGNWDIHDPVGWTKTFGSRSRSKTEELLPKVQLHLQPTTAAATTTNTTTNDDDGEQEEVHKYFPVNDEDVPDNVAIVRTKEQARIVVEKLYQSNPESIYHACDTEVMCIDLKQEGPIGNGFVTCLSMYSGPHFDYGLPGVKPGATLWVDNLDDAYGVLLEFKDWFEDPKYKKVWHNYGFDRHVMFNEGIDCVGLGADTMHMARLQDTSRDKIMSLVSVPTTGADGTTNTMATGYGLEALTQNLLKDENIDDNKDSDIRKKSMKELFGVPRLRKDGSEGSILDIPPVQVLQRDPRFRKKWIEYSCKDAKSTWYLHKVLREKLQNMRWVTNGGSSSTSQKLHADIDAKQQQQEKSKKEEPKYKLTLYDYYRKYMCPFAEVLTDMERRGIYVDKTEHLSRVEKQARLDRDYHCNAFREWAYKQIGPPGLIINPASSTQLATFLFGGAKNVKTGDHTETERVFSILREELTEETLDAYNKALLEEEQKYTQQQHQTTAKEEAEEDELDLLTAAQLKIICKDQGVKASGKKSDLQERLRDHFLNPNSSSSSSSNNNGSKNGATTTNSIDGKTVAELKDLCKNFGLKRSGKKADLQQRLLEYYDANDVDVDATTTVMDDHDDNYNNDGSTSDGSGGVGDEFEHYSDHELSTALLARNLNGAGTRTELLERLRADIYFNKEIMMTIPPTNQKAYISISEALETIAKVSAEKEKSLRGDTNNDTPTSSSSSSSSSSSTNSDSTTTTATTKTNLSEILEYLKVKKEEKAKPKHIDVKIRTLGLLEPNKYTQGGAPSVTADVLRKLAGEDPFADPPVYGTAYEACGGGQVGHDACAALYSLCAIGSIDTMIGNFLTSLQSLADEENSRVHCSLNLNTETGRLSSRRPNLQNQPSLEKDKYKIRSAFQVSTPKNNFIVADYSQLELRILASMTDCKSMIEAFKAGGDFHSRTAVDMFQHVREKIDRGECLLEKTDNADEKHIPLVKDIFASERKKAKTLNFSIAYGKTAHGLSADWGVTKEEAQEMLTKFYEARPEIKDWQDKTKEIAKKFGFTRTLMGRYRHLPHAMPSNKRRNRKLIGHAERASINTPIQGGAADIVMMAMIKLNQSEKLRRLGWILILQIHDEVILEGPKETAKEAFDEVKECMENPWVFGLQKTEVPMIVDGTYTYDNWYDAK